MTSIAGTSPALEAIEFAAALETVAGFAAGVLGAESVRARRPTADARAAAEELATCDQLAGWLRGGGTFRPEPVEDVAPTLTRLEVPGSVLDGPALAQLARTLAAARMTREELLRVAEHTPRIETLAVALPPRGVERLLAATVDAHGTVLDSATPALARVRRRIRETRDRLVARLEAILRRLEPADASTAVTIRAGRYVIPVRRELRAPVPGIVHDESASGATLFVEPTETLELGNALRELEAEEAREIHRVLRGVTEQLRPHTGAIRDAWEMAIAVDDLGARAHFAVAVDGHPPTLVPAPAPLAIRGGRHPLLLARQALGGPPVVPFDLELDARERTVLVSGPNTGGKTVLMKAVGLIAALAQAGIVPPVGPGSTMPVFETFFADIGDRQSIAESLSTFSAHVVALRDVLAHADARSLVLLDEVGAGTDPAEGGALAAAALEALTARRALTIGTTHLGVLKRLAESVAGVVNASLQFDAATLEPTYRLAKGVPGRSYALAIARRLGLPGEVLSRAEAAVPAGDRDVDALLAALESRRAEVERDTGAVRAREKAAERREAALAARESEAARREAALAESQRAATQTARESARRYLLDARKRVEDALGLARQAVDEATAREARRLVEEAIQREPGARAVPEAQREPPVVRPGERVRTALGAEGHVREVRPDGRAVVDVRGMKLVVELSTLEAVPPGAGAEPLPPASRYDDSSAAATVDIRGVRAEEAELLVLRALDDAVRGDLPELRVIHGKGTGALRGCVRRIVEVDPRVASFHPAPPEQGGSGVTVVSLRR